MSIIHSNHELGRALGGGRSGSGAMLEQIRALSRPAAATSGPIPSPSRPLLRPTGRFPASLGRCPAQPADSLLLSADAPPNRPILSLSRPLLRRAGSFQALFPFSTPKTLAFSPLDKERVGDGTVARTRTGWGWGCFAHANTRAAMRNHTHRSVTPAHETTSPSN